MNKLLCYSAIFAGALIVPLHTSFAQAVEKSVSLNVGERTALTPVSTPRPRSASSSSYKGLQCNASLVFEGYTFKETCFTSRSIPGSNTSTYSRCDVQHTPDGCRCFYKSNSK